MKLGLKERTPQLSGARQDLEGTGSPCRQRAGDSQLLSRGTPSRRVLGTSTGAPSRNLPGLGTWTVPWTRRGRLHTPYAGMYPPSSLTCPLRTGAGCLSVPPHSRGSSELPSSSSHSTASPPPLWAPCLAPLLGAVKVWHPGQLEGEEAYSTPGAFQAATFPFAPEAMSALAALGAPTWVLGPSGY